MEVTYPRCCGLDVHKKVVTACAMTPGRRETRVFSTMTGGLLALAAWLKECRITHVAMESTGVYWKPVYNLLESEFELLLANAQHIKAVPGRKTDIKDAEWIADLLRHGLIRGSFVPPRDQREVRELVRWRRSLIHERAAVINRIQKVLEGANIKLSSVATDVVGVSGRAMLRAMIGGVVDPKVLADMAKGSLRKKKESLEEALQGLMGKHQKMLLQSALRHLTFLDTEIARLDNEIDKRLRPQAEPIERLDALPGVNRRSAQEVLAEIGTDMSRFPTAAHLASWARMCPGNNQSAGKRKRAGAGHGNKWLASALVEVARGAVRTRENYFAALYHRLARRLGDKKAVVAVAHSMLVTIYHMLRSATAYQDLGPTYFDQRDREGATRRAVRRLEVLGYNVVLQPA